MPARKQEIIGVSCNIDRMGHMTEDNASKKTGEILGVSCNIDRMGHMTEDNASKKTGNHRRLL